MPVTKNRPPVEKAAEEVIAAMSAELDADERTGNSAAPSIVEDYLPFSKRFSVRVIWDRWKDVPPSERVPLIVEAYRRSKRAGDAPHITTARGLTQIEAQYEDVAEGERWQSFTTLKGRASTE